MECLRLRVKHLDLDRRLKVTRKAKDTKDRITMLSSVLDTGVQSPALRSDRLSAGYGIERATASTVGSRPKSAMRIHRSGGNRAGSRAPLHPISP